MLTIFRTNQLMVSFLLIFYLAVVRLSGFVYPIETSVATQGIAAEWVYGWLGVQGFWADLTAALLLLAQAVAINVMSIDHRLGEEVNLFPGLFYVLVASALPEFQYLSPLHLANTFLIIALWQLLQTYRRSDCAKQIFNIGFWVAVASLFYPAYLIFLLLGFIGLNLLRAVRFREYLTLLSGALVPYVLVGVSAFWYDWLPTFTEQQFSAGFAWTELRIPADGWIYAKLGLYALGLLVVLLSSSTYFFRKTMQVQKKITILYWALFLAGLTLAFQAAPTLDHLLMVAVPFGILLSFTFSSLSSALAEVLHLLLLAAALFFQFWKFIF